MFFTSIWFCLAVGSAPSLSATAGWSRDVPARCAAASVTAVSCAAAGADSLLPHPDDCQLFYYCVGGAAAPVCRQCPAGLHFSPAEHVCAAPEVAGCVLTTLPPTSSSVTSPSTSAPDPSTTAAPTTPQLSTTASTPVSTTQVPHTTIFEPAPTAIPDPNIPNTTIFGSETP